MSLDSTDSHDSMLTFGTGGEGAIMVAMAMDMVKMTKNLISEKFVSIRQLKRSSLCSE